MEGRQKSDETLARISLLDEKQSSTIVMNVQFKRKDSTIFMISIKRLREDSFHRRPSC